MPLASQEVKLAADGPKNKAVFKLFSLGIVTNRDEWIYGDDRESLERRVHFFCDAFTADSLRWKRIGRGTPTNEFVDRSIKWTSELKSHMKRGTDLQFDPNNIYESLYQPLVRRQTYFAPVITQRPYQNFGLFPRADSRNVGFSFSAEDRAEFSVIAFDRLPNKDVFLPNAGQTLCLWRYDETGTRIDNITDWALEQFRKHYQPGRGKKAQPITKEAIFHNVYAVLHDPLYREKYAQNLKREFPRIPRYGESDASFWQWADWGAELMALHIGYETVEPFALTRTDVPDEKVRATAQAFAQG